VLTEVTSNFLCFCTTSSPVGPARYARGPSRPPTTPFFIANFLLPGRTRSLRSRPLPTPSPWMGGIDGYYANGGKWTNQGLEYIKRFLSDCLSVKWPFYAESTALPSCAPFRSTSRVSGVHKRAPATSTTTRRSTGSRAASTHRDTSTARPRDTSVTESTAMGARGVTTRVVAQVALGRALNPSHLQSTPVSKELLVSALSERTTPRRTRTWKSSCMEASRWGRRM